MGRERWFHADGTRRVGPISRQQLVTTLITLAEPRQCRVWHRSLSDWTIAGRVPRIAHELDELLETPRRTAETRAPRAAPPRAEVKPWWAEPKAAIPAGVAAVAVALGLWFLLGRSPPVTPTPSGAPPTVTAPAQPGSGVAQPGASAAPTEQGGSGFAGWNTVEEFLPRTELSKLRGVGGWQEQTLTLTLYNGTSWRVTGLEVRISELEGEQFRDKLETHVLVPEGVDLDASVSQLLNQVAPDRRKPGVNPFDTARFEAKVGPQPEAYRWRIVAALGYAPLGG